MKPRRVKIASHRISRTFGAAAAPPPPFPAEGPPVRPLRFPAGVDQLAAADWCGSVRFNGYYGDPPRPTSPVGN